MGRALDADRAPREDLAEQLFAAELVGEGGVIRRVGKGAAGAVPTRCRMGGKPRGHGLRPLPTLRDRRHRPAVELHRDQLAYRLIGRRHDDLCLAGLPVERTLDALANDSAALPKVITRSVALRMGALRTPKPSTRLPSRSINASATIGVAGAPAARITPVQLKNSLPRSGRLSSLGWDAEAETSAASARIDFASMGRSIAPGARPR